MVSPMQCVPRKGRISLSGNHQHVSQARGLGTTQEAQEIDPRNFNSCAVKIDTALNLDMPPREPLGRTAVKPCDLRRRLVKR